MSTSSPRSLRTPLYRQAHSQSTLSPTSDDLTQSTSSVRTTRSATDPQNLLLQRWHQISSDVATRKLSRKTVIALDRNLDEVEELISWDAPEKRQGREVDYVGLGIGPDVFEHKTIASTPLTPPRSRGFDAPRGDEHGVIDEAPLQQIEPMLEKITYLVNELRKRQEEFRHLHSIAIAKAEQGAKETVKLEQHIQQVEQDLIDDESELTYLKLKLRILEIEAAPHVPTGEQSSLAEGIRIWKLDWADVDNRFRMRRRKRDPGRTNSVTSSISVNQREDLLSLQSQ